MTLLRSTCALVFLLAAQTAHADPVRGTVLATEKEGVYVSLGIESGVANGSQLELIHVVEAMHPVTKKKLRDSFSIGQVVVVNAGKKISLVRGPDAVSQRIAVGDSVELVSAIERVRDPWTESGDKEAVRAIKTSEARVDAATAAHDTWKKTLGRSTDTRIDLWNEYLDTYPKSPYAETVVRELRSLRSQKQARIAILHASENRTPTARSVRAMIQLHEISGKVKKAGPLAYTPPTRTYEGHSFLLTFVIVERKNVSQAWVNVRIAGSETYQRVDLVFDGNLLRARVPQELVKPPYVELFVEVVASDGEPPQTVLGTAADPESVAVDRSVETRVENRKDRSRVTLVADFVDFDGGLGKGFDQYFQSEIDFRYQFRGPVYALRLGLGTLIGTGGPKDVIDDDPTGQCLDLQGNYRCRRVDYTYSYVELEFRPSKNFSLMLRPVAGSATRLDASNDIIYFPAYGLVTRIRIGPEEATNLTLGVSLNDKFGTLFEAAFSWNGFATFPLVLSVQVTNQPVPEDFGVRLIADIGWRKLSWFYPSVRVSYQARDVDHAGVSFGTAMNFDW